MYMKKAILTGLWILMATGLWAQTPAAEASMGKREMLTVSADDPTDGPHRAAILRVIGQPEAIPAIPVVLVEFKNRTFSINNVVANVDSMFNGRNWNLYGATGSVRQYYENASNGAYSPRFDIYGPVTANKSDIGYGRYCPGLPNEVATKMDTLIDFSQYDANDDGVIDLMYILYAGYGPQDGNQIPSTAVSSANISKLIWPHWGSSATGTFDGKKLRYYEASNELDAFMEPGKYLYGIGLVCHEFCHALGLPDLYRTDGSDTKKRLGMWDIMDYGCYNNNVYTPSTLSAWERWFMGWLEPTLLTSAGHYELGELQATNQAYLITADGCEQSDVNSTTPYYLLENRQQTGWDDALEGTEYQGRYGVQGHGMLLYRIHQLSQGHSWQGCNNSEPFGVDIVEADGLRPTMNTNNVYNGFLGKMGDCFPHGATSYQMTELYGFQNVTEDSTETGVTIGFDFTAPNDPTALEQTGAARHEGEKCVVDGKVLIRHGNNLYDESGRVRYHQVPPRPQHVPAYPGLILRVDAEGDTIGVYLRGDERHHWVITEDGYRVVEKNNMFYYVSKSGRPSRRKAKAEHLRSKTDLRWLRWYGKKEN